MRIERLSDSRIRVTLTTADLMGLNITIEQLRADSKELHAFLFNIMETIKAETGFNPYNGQVVVEATPYSEGISIVISKIHTSASEVGRQKKIKSITPHIKKSEPEIFYFECMDDLCAALVETEKEALIKGSLYKLENEYCIILNSERKNLKSRNVLLEYAMRRKLGIAHESFVKEHGRLIAEMENLVVMTEKIKNLT